jgi:hypothetical protein
MSIFADEWRACLREQYKFVVAANEQVTLQSLTEVMVQVGFGDDELAQLRVEATIRVEDVPDDFVPDLHVLRSDDKSQMLDEFRPHPLECQCPACVELAFIPHDEDGQPLEVDEEERISLQNKEGDQPRQMSLF